MIRKNMTAETLASPSRLSQSTINGVANHPAIAIRVPTTMASPIDCSQTTMASSRSFAPNIRATNAVAPIETITSSVSKNQNR